jgi:hypothetical protein
VPVTVHLKAAFLTRLSGGQNILAGRLTVLSKMNAQALSDQRE